MNSLVDLIRLHGTKMLGFLGVTLGVLAVADPSLVGGDRAIKYYLLGISLLNTWRGFFTSDAFKMGVVLKQENAAKADAIIKDQGVAGSGTDPFKPKSHWLASLLVVLVVWMMMGCAALSQTLGAKRAAAYTVLSVTNDTAAILVNAGTIDKPTALKVLSMTRQARQGVDIAPGIVDIDSALKLAYDAQDLLCKDKPTNLNCQFMKARSDLP